MGDNVLLGRKEHFPTVGPIGFEGRDSQNPLAFKWYEPTRVVMGKPMADWFKFAVAYWHSFCNTGGDPFGTGTQCFSWQTAAEPMARAQDKLDAAFEVMTKLGVTHFCFHDFDLVEEADTLAESKTRLDQVVAWAQDKMAATGIKLLWGTANLFSHPRYMNGAMTNPDFGVVAHAAAQVKNALDATIALDGENYVFWGGREGYLSLLNTDMKKEKQHLARVLSMARDHARSQGFKGTFFIEPKPCEPTKHQYDFDAATVIGFLHEHGLADDFKLNIEVNHATLAGHSFEHELQTAADAGMLGSIDANRGDPQNGWDTDQFPIDLVELTQAMMVIFQAGGLQGGGVNFDAKLRRNSIDPEDWFIAHIAGMDAFARAAITAEKVLTQTDYLDMKAKRYASFDQGPGAAFAAGQSDLKQLADWANNQPAEAQAVLGRQSGKQEWLEALIVQSI